MSEPLTWTRSCPSGITVSCIHDSKDTCSRNRWGLNSLTCLLPLYVFSFIFKSSSESRGCLQLPLALTFKSMRRNEHIYLLFYTVYCYVRAPLGVSVCVFEEKNFWWNFSSDLCIFCWLLWHVMASLIAQLVENLPAMQETLVPFLGWEDPLEKG